MASNSNSNGSGKRPARKSVAEKDASLDGDLASSVKKSSASPSKKPKADGKNEVADDDNETHGGGGALAAALPKQQSTNRFVRAYGKRVIVAAYEVAALGFIWLIAKRKRGTQYDEGLVRMYEAEWGLIDVTELEASITDRSVSLLKRPVKIFKKLLPCTLAELWTATSIHTYFDDDRSSNTM